MHLDIAPAITSELLYGLGTMPRGELDTTLADFLQEMRERDMSRAKSDAERMNLVLAEVHAVRKDMREEFSDVRQDIRGVQARVSVLEAGKITPRGSGSHSVPPTAQELGLKPSASGQVRVEDVQAVMSEKLMELGDEMAELNARLREERARADGAQEALEQAAEQDRKRWSFRLKVAVAATPVVLAFGAAMAKLLHL